MADTWQPEIDELAAMWQAYDPMPAGLAETVLVALAMEDLDQQYELLHLVERTRELAGARGDNEALTVVFTGGELSLMLRISPIGERERRLDGWISPARAARVTVRQQDATWNSTADGLGRFEIARLPSGLSRVVLSAESEAPQSGSADTQATTPTEDGHLFATPAFEV
ncbi:MAG TPA: hypothetical protein VFL99_04095 [Segeticoccus sp.]|uniref:hypothetical protein n=1 Tax=Segeticoccus sp. TaxID=2706531 RepID=UPI002D8061EA|nr:hypothetical protein [Segeticoccus sp.]HET8599484.1 hypothetical protein [Segeticoccus sp.]